MSDELWKAKLGKYLTMVYGVIDVEKNRLQYSLGGHYPSPLLFDGQQSQFLLGTGFAVGILQDAQFSCQELSLPEKFILLLCSDGVIEILPGKNLGEKENTLMNVLDSMQSTIKELFQKLTLSDTEMPPDDIAMLMIKREVA
jgi:serine phosphatase RsbU (regulator of sigma subunit)